MNNPKLAKRIKQLRIELGYARQEDFARALGLSKQNIQMYEAGSEPKSKFYINLFKLHGIDPLYLMGISDNKYCLTTPAGSKKTKRKATIRYIETGTHS